MHTKNIGTAFALLALASCNMLQRNEFEIKNETGHELSDVQISFADDIVKRQSLAPGETFSFNPSPDRSGGINISYVANGKRLEQKLGYAAPPISMTCKFVVVDNDLRGDCIQN